MDKDAKPVEVAYVNFGENGWSAVWNMDDGSKRELPIQITSIEQIGVTMPENDAVVMEDVEFVKKGFQR